MGDTHQSLVQHVRDGPIEQLYHTPLVPARPNKTCGLIGDDINYNL